MGRKIDAGENYILVSGEENVVLEIGAFSTPTSWLLDNDAILGQDMIQRLRGNGRRQSPTRTAFVSRRAFLLAIPTRRASPVALATQDAAPHESTQVVQQISVHTVYPWLPHSGKTHSCCASSSGRRLGTTGTTSDIAVGLRQTDDGHIPALPGANQCRMWMDHLKTMRRILVTAQTRKRRHQP